MSVRAVVEVAVHFESFRNVDLFHQGLYFMKVRLRRERGERLAEALGCTWHNSHQAVDTRGHSDSDRPNLHNLVPAHVLEEQGEFSTRCFLIRYCEEEVELNDLGQFRFELEASELSPEASAALLEVDLMFADLTPFGGADRFGESPNPSSAEFKAVSKQVFRVSGAHKGLHEFVPVVFDEYHFAVACLTLHSTLLDYRFRLRRQPAPVQVSESSPRASGSSAPAIDEASGRSASEGVEALSLGEHLFACLDGAGREPLVSRAEAFCRHHVEQLAASRLQLLSWADEALSACLVPSLREALAPDLLLPHKAVPSKSPLGSVGSISTDGTTDRDDIGTTTSVRGRLEAALVSSRKPNGRLWDALASQSSLEIAAAGCRVAEVWHELLTVVLHVPSEMAMLLRGSWERGIAERWSHTIVRERALDGVREPGQDCPCEGHAEGARSLREALLRSQGAPPCVVDGSLVPEAELRPVVFEQCYRAESTTVKRSLLSGGFNAVSTDPEAQGALPSDPKSYRGVHLFVFVHGFQGNSYDMRLMRNNLALAYPDAVFLSSTSNEECTDGDIAEMGARLALEVRSYVAEWCPGFAMGRLSFVAHSMGGLIARSAASLLTEFQGKMFTFLSFSTPHLGIFQDKISLFNTGFWVLKKWKQSTFLQQISMADHEDPRRTLLYKLTQARCLEYFQNVVFMSSFEDQYGPFRSARAEFADDWGGQADRKVYREMVDNLWGPVRPERVVRLDVDFVLPERNLDAIIGRAAHIQFLECQPVMKMLVHNFSHFFR